MGIVTIVNFKEHSATSEYLSTITCISFYFMSVNYYFAGRTEIKLLGQKFFFVVRICNPDLSEPKAVGVNPHGHQELVDPGHEVAKGLVGHSSWIQ